MKALVRTTHEFFEEYCTASMRVSQETLRSQAGAMNNNGYGRYLDELVK